MRRQPPDKNNPANPLLKVAALQIDKERDRRGANTAKVRATLNFKRSDDLQGAAEGKNGRQIFVNFGLSLGRASLRVSFQDDRGNSPSGLVKIKRVAFSEPLTQVRQTREDHTSEKTTAAEAGADVSAKLPLHGLPALPSVGGTIKGNAKKKQTDKKHDTFHRDIVNIRSTFAGNEAHWEINPFLATGDTKDKFLEGEVFKLTKSGNITEACTVSRTDGNDIATLVVRGSVYINMSDLKIENIVFTDEVGAKVGLNEVEPATSLFDNVAFQENTKRRILKQIIRKHLIDQGMNAEGPLVEICRAEN